MIDFFWKKKLTLKKSADDNKSMKITQHAKSMGESFQDYSWIQDFEDDFPQKVICGKSSSKCWIKEIVLASDLFSVCLRTTAHLNL